MGFTSFGSQESPPSSVSGQWRQIAATSNFPPADGIGLVNLNGVLYQFGGWGPGSFPVPYTHNQVRLSIDGGRTWVRIADAPWERRHTFAQVTHNGKVFVIGGDANSAHYQFDIWSATQDEDLNLVWELKNSNAAPLSQGRVLFQAFSHDDKIWIMGGQTIDDFSPPTGPANPPSTKPGGPYYDDVWSSSDEGETWALVSTGNPWAPVGLIGGAPVKDGYMWLIGGGAYDTEGNPRVYKNSAWRSMDGVEWEEVVSSALFSGRQYHNVNVFKGEFVVIAGYRNGNLADAYASPDAVNWRNLGVVPWQARHAASVCEYNDELIMFGGPLDETAVWAMR